MLSLLCNSQSQWLPSSDSSSRLRRPAAPPPWLVFNTWSVLCRLTWSPTDSGCHDFNLMSVKLIMINNHLTSPPPHHLSETLICFCSIIYITCCVILSLFIFLFLPLRGDSLSLLRGNKSIKQPREAFSQFASTLKAGPKVAANPAHQTAASRHAEAHVWDSGRIQQRLTFTRRAADKSFRILADISATRSANKPHLVLNKFRQAAARRREGFSRCEPRRRRTEESRKPKTS